MYKYQLGLRTVLFDKLFLALLFLALGYMVSRSLEAYKSSLQKELEQFKFEQSALAASSRLQQEGVLAQQQQSYARELSNIRSQQELVLAQQQQSYARDLSSLRSQQEGQLAVLRNQEERQSEALPVMLGTQSQLAARRVVAYANLWAAYGKLLHHVAHVPLPVFADFLRKKDGLALQAATRTFEETLGIC